jgi:hypothetical protein
MDKKQQSSGGKTGGASNKPSGKSNSRKRK